MTSLLIKSSLGRSSNKVLAVSKRFSSSSTSALAYKQLHRNRSRPSLPTLDAPAWSANSAVSSILYESPVQSKAPKTQHILNCLVQNEPGVLSLISGTLAARGFNIDSLVVCNTEVKDLSRMTITLDGHDAVIEQARRQIEDLVPVYAVLDYTNSEIIKRELLLARVSILGPEYFQELIAHHNEEPLVSVEDLKFHPSNLAPSEALRQKHSHLESLSSLAKQFGGKIVDISDRSCIIELSAKPSRITSFVKLIQPFGILELARSGMMALPRTPLKDYENEEVATESNEEVDISQLPPG
ncbi:hypothetical protein PACTADRAFT_48343 [Pachysolen tannophilus NRRL Y-2460]|uniref:ACT domain-containing protein n=1 Tax=Pachysolen tannophilus NRRL Y-2460 TaxID=669874 RepID=A0A1E4U3Q1_PACTA|nr:hypothetical protein PACTADRAFT_48343 [Pachysolen tannophilus NRRL Y-2460]